jgi:hypothetical protein
VDEQLSPARKSRRDRFLSVGARRTRSVLKDLRSLAKCANKSAYDYTEGDVLKIFSAVEEELEATRALFEKSAKREVKFELE